MLSTLNRHTLMCLIVLTVPCSPVHATFFKGETIDPNAFEQDRQERFEYCMAEQKRIDPKNIDFGDCIKILEEREE